MFWKMKTCKVCGEEIVRKAKLCPHCGSRVKRTPVFLIVILAVLFIGMIGNMANEKDDSSSKENTPSKSVQQKNNDSSVSSTSANGQHVVNIEKAESPDDILKKDVLSYLQENNAEGPKVTVTEKRVEIRLGSDYTESEQPENWNEIKENYILLSNSLKNDVSQIGDRVVSISVYGSEQTILLTVIGEKPSYDVFKPVEQVESFEVAFSIKMDAEVLFEYGEYMEGQSVVTVIAPQYIKAGEFDVYTENNKGIVPSFTCKFENKDITKVFNEDVPLTIVGYVTIKEGFGSKIELINCSVVGSGEMAEDLKNNRDEQIEIGEKFKEEFENKINAANASERQSYIDSCVTVSYSDIERNPDNYKGTRVQISGTVDQVIEGWFDSVTLIINCSGNKWYATYKREEGESRILEGDYISAYGECDGVTSYLTILGAQVTVPAIKIAYYY